MSIIAAISTLMKNLLDKANIFFWLALEISYKAKNKENDVAFAEIM